MSWSRPSLSVAAINSIVENHYSWSMEQIIAGLRNNHPQAWFLFRERAQPHSKFQNESFFPQKFARYRLDQAYLQILKAQLLAEPLTDLSNFDLALLCFFNRANSSILDYAMSRADLNTGDKIEFLAFILGSYDSRMERIYLQKMLKERLYLKQSLAQGCSYGKDALFKLNRSILALHYQLSPTLKDEIEQENNASELPLVFVDEHLFGELDKQLEVEKKIIEALKEGQIDEPLSHLFSFYSVYKDKATAVQIALIHQRFSVGYQKTSSLWLPPNNQFFSDDLHYALHQYFYRENNPDTKEDKTGKLTLEDLKKANEDTFQVVMSVPWGDYIFETSTNEISADEMKAEVVYIYPKPQEQFAVMCFHQSINFDLHSLDSLIVTFKNLIKPLYPCLFMKDDVFYLYSCQQGQWKLTVLDSAAFIESVGLFQQEIVMDDISFRVVEANQIPELVLNEIRNKGCHIDAIGFSFQNRENKMMKGEIGLTGLTYDNYNYLIQAVYSGKNEDLSTLIKKQFLNLMSYQDVVPRLRVGCVDAVTVDGYFQVHKNKLSMLGWVRFLLEQKTEAGCEEGITDRVIEFCGYDLDTRERKKLTQFMNFLFFKFNNREKACLNNNQTLTQEPAGKFSL